MSYCRTHSQTQTREFNNENLTGTNNHDTKNDFNSFFFYYNSFLQILHYFIIKTKKKNDLNTFRCV